MCSRLHSCLMCELSPFWAFLDRSTRWPQSHLRGRDASTEATLPPPPLTQWSHEWLFFNDIFQILRHPPSWLLRTNEIVQYWSWTLHIHGRESCSCALSSVSSVSLSRQFPASVARCLWIHLWIAGAKCRLVTLRGRLHSPLRRQRRQIPGNGRTLGRFTLSVMWLGTHLQRLPLKEFPEDSPSRGPTLAFADYSNNIEI